MQASAETTTTTFEASASTSNPDNAVNAHSETNSNINRNGHRNSKSHVDLSALENLIGVSAAFLRQAVVLVNESLSEDEQLTYVSKYSPGSTIGTSFLQLPCLHLHLHTLSLRLVPAQENTFGTHATTSRSSSTA
ncbi:hypothetical protein EW145_g8373 [Phellinidium pouzarii]|uniref:Uncharacterized protein n=1 Tax=Phellinidium pouzarii TaxID=167371 RepID=A0A4S4K6M1_9AGAM|nr:hypothetical protein EW145_g8373 [Phellinidium pouzarii]